MSEQKLENHQDNKGARRSRKDQQGRDYICGCGKKYLSYPALYTHIKTKHQGQHPEGTQKTGLPTYNKRTKQKIQQKLAKEIQSMIKFSDLTIINHLGSNALGSVPFPSRTKKQQLGKILWESFTSLTKKNELGKEKKIDLGTILIVYLIGVGQYVQESLYTEYVTFARLFLNCYLQHGQQVYQTCFKGEGDSRIRSISIDDCKFSPIICEFFIRYYLPEYGYSEQQNQIKIFICLQFCTWLYNKRLSLVSVDLIQPASYKLPEWQAAQKFSFKNQKKSDQLKNINEADDSRDQNYPKSSQIAYSHHNGQLRQLQFEDKVDHLDSMLFGHH